jgi:solute carrier family 8 (sodium/calcium exchanger)
MCAWKKSQTPCVAYAFQGATFHVPTGELAFTVVVFCVEAVISIVLLLARRYLSVFGRAELGGPAVTKAITGSLFFALWIGYVVMSSLQAVGHIKGNFW